MAGFVIERHGYETAAALASQIVSDMIAHGFVMKYPTGTFTPSTNDPFRVILEASGDIDPLNDDAVSEKQPWRICVDVIDKQRFLFYVATPMQLTDDGGIATELTDAETATDILGSVGAVVGSENLTVDGTYTPDTDNPLIGLINRTTRVGDHGKSYPLSYRMAITNRGFWLGVWEESISATSASNFNWVLVQRPVDRVNGSTLTTGKAPVFCVNSVGGKYWQFVVRESDVNRPGPRRIADSNNEDSESVINTKTQVSLSEDGKYIVTFPSRLNTARYRYPHELDIMGVTSADVVAQYSDIPLTFYGESSARIYTALHANTASNTGMRVLILKTGGGID